MNEWLVRSWVGSIECCLKGCDNETRSHEFDSTTGQCEMKFTHNWVRTQHLFFFSRKTTLYSV